jgi:methylphosphotriester-DNA--protein-cysteine methyltransferase
MRKYVGNTETRLYHVNLPLQEQCKKASETDVANIVYFDIQEEAVKAGYKPCLLCILKRSEYI